MNETYDVITHTVNRKKTRALGKQIAKLIDGYDAATIISALVPILVELNISNHLEENDTVCRPCAMVGLTELLQAIRQVSDDMMDEIPDVD